MLNAQTNLIFKRLFNAIVSLAAISLFTACNRDPGAGAPAVANPESIPETIGTVSVPQKTTHMPQTAPERLWPRTPAGEIPVKTWKTAEAIFHEDNLFAGCENIVEPNDAQKILILLQNDLNNQFDLICSRSQEESEKIIVKIRDSYLDNDETRTEIHDILSQKEAQIRRGVPPYSSCKGELYENEKRLKIVFKENLIFVKAAEKHSYSSGVKDDETGQTIISEGVTGVIYALVFRDGSFRIAEKLRAPSLLSPEEEEYSPTFF